MANSYLTHTHGGAATLLTKGTFSAWIKRCEFGDYHLIYTQGDNAGNEQFYMLFLS